MNNNNNNNNNNGNENGSGKSNGNGKNSNQINSADNGIKVPQKFGTFMGVYTPSILTILGVIMYLRMGWVVGQTGLIGTFIIVTIASLITFLTGLSISATATNMTVKTGGAYYMISRSFGIESGAAVGIPLFLAQAIGISFYLSGFAESVHELLPAIPISWIGLVSLVTMTLLANFSPSLALKTQIVIFVLIILSIVSVVVGTPIDNHQVSEIPLSTQVPFWVVFSIFFPAVTGILSGVSMSGDLKNPGKSIPLGTMAAIITGYAIYLLIPFVLWKMVPSHILLKDNMIISKLAMVPQLIFLGIWGATLSSALGSLLAAPRTMQALANDRIIPRFFGKGFGPSNNPYVATISTFLLASVGVLWGSLDLIAPILTMFFLTSYGILNLIAALETLIGNPSWRPRFRIHWVVSFSGAIACFSAMIFINPFAAYAAIIFCTLVYLVMKKRNVGAKWSDMRRGLLLHLVRDYLYKLSQYEETARTWRPNLLVFSGAPSSRWHLIELADAISHGKGFLTVCSILKSLKMTQEKAKKIEKSMQQFLKKKQVPALTKIKLAEDKIDGIKALIEDYGLGDITPNTLIFGEAEEDDDDSLIDFSTIIKIVNVSNKNILLVRNHEKFDSSVLNQKKEQKFIDLWWGNIPANSNLMLALSYMLRNSPEWIGSTLRIRKLVADEDERQGVIKNLDYLNKNGRIQATIDVYVKKENIHPLVQMSKYSKDADLVFIELRPFNTDESSDEYSYYYQDIIENINKFPMLVITLAGEKLRFEDIFDTE